MIIKWLLVLTVIIGINLISYSVLSISLEDQRVTVPVADIEVGSEATQTQLRFFIVSVGKSQKGVNVDANDIGCDDKPFLENVIFRGKQYKLIGPEIIGNEDILSLSSSADLHSNSSDKPSINIELTAIGAEKLSKATEDNIGHNMMIILDREPVSIATIQSKLGAKMQVTGMTSDQVQRALLISGTE